jgi:hypothetical protein
MGPGGSGLPGALGTCALAKIMDATKKIATQNRSNKQDPRTLTAEGRLESPSRRC